MVCSPSSHAPVPRGSPWCDPRGPLVSAEASGFSWPVFCQRGWPSNPTPNPLPQWCSNNALLLLSMNFSSRVFCKRVQNPKEYLWCLRFHRCPALLVWRCFGEETEYISRWFADSDVSWVQGSGQPGSHLRKKCYCSRKGGTWKTRSLSAEYPDAWEFACLLFKIKNRCCLVPAVRVASPSALCTRGCVCCEHSRLCRSGSHPGRTPFGSHPNSSQSCN